MKVEYLLYAATRAMDAINTDTAAPISPIVIVDMSSLIFLIFYVSDWAKVHTIPPAQPPYSVFYSIT